MHSSTTRDYALRVTCCADPDCGGFFTERVARRDAKGYRRKGLGSLSGSIVRFLADRGVEGATVLEAGGGIGAIQLELLKAGAANATNVEPINKSNDNPQPMRGQREEVSSR